MDTDNQSQPVKQTKSRSRLYPRYHLEHAVNFAKIINDLGGNRISSEAVAAKMHKATNNSVFIGRVSSAKQFGLVTLESGKLSLTSLSQRIFFPKSDEDKKAALVTAFLTPPFYSDLIVNYKGRMLPDRTNLGNILKTDYGIQANARETAAANFIASAEYIGAINNGLLVVPSTNDISTSEESSEIDDSPSHAPVSTETPSIQSVRPTDKQHFRFGDIDVYIPRTERFTDGITDGGFKTAKDAIKAFSDEYGDKLEPNNE